MGIQKVRTIFTVLTLSFTAWLRGKDDIFGAAPVLGTNAVVENLISLYRAFSINFLGCVCVVEVALKKSLIREAYNF